MAKRIIAVCFEIPGAEILNVDFDSEQSLLDADIVVVQPSLIGFYSSTDFQGKPSLNEYHSFRLKEKTEHWRREVNTAFNEGKTVFFFLSKFREVYVDSGQKEYSGTGKSPRTTILVEPFNNYMILPVSLGTIIPGTGRHIVPAGNLGVLAGYWNDFQAISSFESYIDGLPKGTLLITKTGKKAVGGVYQCKNGFLVVLPPLSIIGSKYRRGNYWTADAKKLGKLLVQHLVNIDDALKVRGVRTPPPEWIKASQYDIKAAKEIRLRVEQIDVEIEGLQEERSDRLIELDHVNSSKHLLYEQGRPLEDVVLECLRAMGFKAHRFAEGDSDFDAVFESPEGRFIGEVEGKDKSAVSIEKLSQLERNIQEDFSRDEVNEHAKGVLLGNAYRLMQVHERDKFFTDKCLSGAKRAGVALVRTPDLFAVLTYLRQHPGDNDFKNKCREALLNTSGNIVQFPDIPEK